MATTIKKDVRQWSNQDLSKWATGEVESAQPVTDRDVADEVIRRRNLDAGMSVEDVQAHMNGDKESVPETPEAATTEAPEAPTPEPEKVAVPNKPEPPKTSLHKVGGGGSGSLTVIEQNLQNYIEAMTPGRSHRGDEGPQHQIRLYRTIMMVLRQKGADFNEAYGLLLKTVLEHREDVFHEMYIFRYMDTRRMQSGLTSNERRNFERVLNMVMTTCNPKTRARTIQQVDINATMMGFNDPEMHERVTAFYRGM